MHTHSGHWQLAASGLAIGSGLLGWSEATALFLTVAGVIAVVQVLAWKPGAVWARAAAVDSLCRLRRAWRGVAGGGCARRRRRAARRLAGARDRRGGFSVLIIGMVTRTAPDTWGGRRARTA